ncbi:MAG: O-antigen ligase family protein, partial [Chloroflexota bacterium]
MKNWLSPSRLLLVERFLWAAVLVALPVTSFRFLPFFGDAQVRPLSFVPASLLFLLVLWRSFRERKLVFWTPSLLLLLVFALIAVVSTAWGALLSPPDLHNHTYLARSLRAWITFFVGLLFLLVSISQARGEDDLKFTFKWLYIGLVGHVAVSLLQLVEIHITSVIFENAPLGNVVDAFQKTIMMAGISPNKRISGLTLEPSWLAAQIAVLYLPWVVGSLLTGYRLFKRRFVTLLLFLGLLVFALLTYSRSGFAVIILASFLTAWITRRGWIPNVKIWFHSPFGQSDTYHPRRTLNIALRLLVVVVILTGLASLGVALSANNYFAVLWKSDSTGLIDYFVDIYAGPRLAYAFAGWNVFTQHPWFGVGLGGAGLYLHAAMPNWAHFNISEVSQIFSSDYMGYPNVKNLFVRLLAETGIAGCWAFLSFYLLMLGKTLKALKSREKVLMFMGSTGLFSFIAILAIGFSLDAFAMPMIWIP